MKLLANIDTPLIGMPKPMNQVQGRQVRHDIVCSFFPKYLKGLSCRTCFGISNFRKFILKQYKTVLLFACCLSLTTLKAKYRDSVLFNYTGSLQHWVVPACVTQITCYMWGAGGGHHPVKRKNKPLVSNSSFIAYSSLFKLYPNPADNSYSSPNC